MPLFTSRRWAYGALAWLIFFIVSHLALLFFPSGDLRTYTIFNVVLIAMSTAGAAVVVATVRPWARPLPRWLILTPLWFGSVLLVVRGVPGMVENLLMVTGVRRGGFVGAQDISTGEFWAGLAINTYFFVGAVLLVGATVSHVRRSVDPAE
ncbi:hypothetical protein ACWEOS_20225 [Micromonospora taraxaci]|uniref:hypothetical protein n=1 Tax=Micromonospora taraxaci TaxID=1316803 RepID=UPI003C2F1E3F